MHGVLDRYIEAVSHKSTYLTDWSAMPHSRLGNLLCPMASKAEGFGSAAVIPASHPL
jgi:hypothetical protein